MVGDNWGGMNPLEMMPFKKYCSKINKIYSDETVMLNGSFRDKVTGEIIENDIFEAHWVGGSLEETYKAYLGWFNYTNCDSFENEREFVSVKVVKKSEVLKDVS